MSRSPINGEALRQSRDSGPRSPLTMQIDSTTNGRTDIVRIRGDVTGLDAVALLARCREAAHGEELVIDLGSTGRIDAAGVAAVRAVLKRHRALGRDARVVGATQHVSWLLDLVGAASAEAPAVRAAA